MNTKKLLVTPFKSDQDHSWLANRHHLLSKKTSSPNHSALNWFPKCEFLFYNNYILHRTSVGSNPNITNFELLQTWQVELQTYSNPGSSTKTKLQTLSKPSKKPKPWTCLARYGPNPGPHPEKLNYEVWTHSNTPKMQNFEPMNWVWPNTSHQTLDEKTLLDQVKE